MPETRITDNELKKISNYNSKSPLHNNDKFIIEDSEDSGKRKYIDFVNLAALIDSQTIFGTQYQYEESLGEASTTSATYQQKLRMSTPTVPAGDYMVEFDYMYASDDNKVECLFRVQLNDTTTLYESSPAVAETYTNGCYMHISGFKEVTLTNDSHDIDFDYANSNNKTTYVKDVKMKIYRVS